MKTLKIAFVVMLSCLFLLTGCAEDQDRIYSLSEEINDLDELIRKSDRIVVGTVTDEEQFISKGQPDKFTFTVKNELKGNVEEELAIAKDLIKILNGSIEQTTTFTLPIEESTRNILKIKKIGPTPKGYPRLYDKMQKELKKLQK